MHQDVAPSRRDRPCVVEGLHLAFLVVVEEKGVAVERGAAGEAQAATLNLAPAESFVFERKMYIIPLTRMLVRINSN